MKGVSFSSIGRLKVIKMLILHKLTSRFNTIPAGFLQTFAKLILKFLGKYEKSRLAKTSFKKNLLDLTLPDLKIYYEYNAVIKAVLYSCKDRHFSGIQCKIQEMVNYPHLNG